MMKSQILILVLVLSLVSCTPGNLSEGLIKFEFTDRYKDVKFSLSEAKSILETAKPMDGWAIWKGYTPAVLTYEDGSQIHLRISHYGNFLYARELNHFYKFPEDQEFPWPNVTTSFPKTGNHLIAQLAEMKADSLNCSADIYWQIVSKGADYIPQLIQSLTDTTATSISHACSDRKLTVGELAYFALQEIGDFPAFLVTNIQFDYGELKNGQPCDSFYSYLFNHHNKKEYQHKMRLFYNNYDFEYVTYPKSEQTSCMKQYHITGRYKVIIPESSLNDLETDSSLNDLFDPNASLY